MVTGGDTTARNTSTRSVQLNSSEILQEGGWKLSSSELPKSITNFCTVQINHSTVMTIGGFGPGYVQNTYIFNSELLSWSSGPLLNSKRERLACGNVIWSLNSYHFSIIAVGGSNNVDHNKTTEILDDIEGNWRLGPELPFAIDDGSLMEDPAGGVILIGGESTEIGVLNTHFTALLMLMLSGSRCHRNYKLVGMCMMNSLFQTTWSTVLLLIFRNPPFSWQMIWNNSGMINLNIWNLFRSQLVFDYQLFVSIISFKIKINKWLQ